MIRILATSLALALVATSANAVEQAPAARVASATAVHGPVQVNHGEQFLPLQVGQSLVAGDRVMALRDSSATLTFDDGCTLTVAAETLIVVPSSSTCAGAVVIAQTIAPGSATAVGGAAGSAGVDLSGLATIASLVAVGDAYLLNVDENQTVSP